MSTEGFLLATCHHCGQNIEFPEQGVGIAISCPHCAGEMVLEDVFHEPVDGQEQMEITAGELKAAMTGTVSRRRVSAFYQLGLLIVAIFMVLLPVTYLAFVGCVAYATYWYG